MYPLPTCISGTQKVIVTTRNNDFIALLRRITSWLCNFATILSYGISEIYSGVEPISQVGHGGSTGDITISQIRKSEEMGLPSKNDTMLEQTTEASKSPCACSSSWSNTISSFFGLHMSQFAPHGDIVLPPRLRKPLHIDLLPEDQTVG